MELPAQLAATVTLHVRASFTLQPVVPQASGQEGRMKKGFSSHWPFFAHSQQSCICWSFGILLNLSILLAVVDVFGVVLVAEVLLVLLESVIGGVHPTQPKLVSAFAWYWSSATGQGRSAATGPKTHLLPTELVFKKVQSEQPAPGAASYFKSAFLLSHSWAHSSSVSPATLSPESRP